MAGSVGWPIKYVRMHPDRRRRFEAVCKALGLREYEVIDQVLAKWIGENEQQARISSFLPNQQQITIIADRVDLVASKVNLLSIKTELGSIVKVLEKEADQFRTSGNHWDSFPALRTSLLRQLQRAARLHPDERDPELQELVARAEKNLA
jgi:hypothetical protein